MSRLTKGCIYKIKYTYYNNDPNPLILVLFCGRKLTHALNIRYLGPTLTNELVDFVTKIATKRITYNNDTYELYHGYMKRKLPGIIALSYRTYRTKYIKNEKLVSKGFFEVKNFLWQIKKNFTKKEVKIIKKKIKKAIKYGDDLKKRDKLIKIFSLFKKDEEITSDELNRRVNMYVNEIDKILKSRKKLNRKKYTTVKNG